MTRKRFCKLMMARGFSRNGAQRIADCADGMTSYERIYQATSHIDLDDFTHKIGVMMQRLTVSLSAGMDAFLTALPDLVTRANNAVQELCETIAQWAEGGSYGGD